MLMYDANDSRLPVWLSVTSLKCDRCEKIRHVTAIHWFQKIFFSFSTSLLVMVFIDVTRGNEFMQAAGDHCNSPICSASSGVNELNHYLKHFSSIRFFFYIWIIEINQFSFMKRWKVISFSIVWPRDVMNYDLEIKNFFRGKVSFSILLAKQFTCHITINVHTATWVIMKTAN